MNSSTSAMVTVAPLDVLERRAVTFADLKLRPPFFPRLPWCRAEKNNNGGHTHGGGRGAQAVSGGC